MKRRQIITLIMAIPLSVSIITACSSKKENVTQTDKKSTIESKKETKSVSKSETKLESKIVETKTESKTVETTKVVDTKLENSDFKLNNLNFTLDGKQLKIPMKYSDLKSIGYSLNPKAKIKENDMIKANEKSFGTNDIVNPKMAKSRAYLSIGLLNDTSSSIKATDSKIWTISANVSSEDDKSKHPKLVLQNNITFNLKREDVIKAFGNPKEEIKNSFGTTLFYEFGEKNNSKITLEIDNKKGVTKIKIEDYTY